MASEETYRPRHGRHSAAGRHVAERVEKPEAVVEEEQPKPRRARHAHAAPSPQPEQVEAPSPQPVQPEAPLSSSEPFLSDDPMLTVPIADGDQETSMSDAPRPIGVDPEETGSFSRISATEGARLTTRSNASDTASFMAQAVRPVEAVRMSSAGRPQVDHREVEMQSNKSVFIVLGLGALAVIGLVVVLLGRAFNSVEETNEPPVYEQVQATGDEGIEYRGATYKVAEQAAGKYALVSSSEGSEGDAVLYELTGTPTTLILYNTAFIIPENLADNTWDLIAHPLGGGSVTQQVTDSNGDPIVGEGQIKEATLSGDAIIITTESGEQLSVSLV